MLHSDRTCSDDVRHTARKHCGARHADRMRVRRDAGSTASRIRPAGVGAMRRDNIGKAIRLGNR